MNSIKKVVALMIVLATMLGCVSVFAYTDVPADLTDAVNALSALGVFVGYPDGTFKPDGAITRSEATAVMVRLLGAGALAQPQRETIFADVPASNWASGYIAFANEHDIVIGFPDGNFYPEQQVTYEQMVKMLVCTMGYGLKAEAEGGYPNGYLYVANNIGLTRGVTGSVGAAAFRGIVAQLAFNALDIPIMAQVTFGGVEMWVVEDGTSRESTVRKTLMSENLGTVKLAAIITRNYLSGEKAGTVMARITDNYKFRYSTDYVIYTEENGAEYVFNDLTGKASSLIGKPVIMFAKISGTTLKKADIIWITEAIASKTLAIEGIQLVEVIPGDAKNDTKIVYTDANDKEITIRVPQDGLDLYVNGLSWSWTDGTFEPNEKAANVKTGYGAGLMQFETLYANILFYKSSVETKAEYDTAYIECYKTMLVDSVNVTDEVIDGKTPTDAKFRITDIDYSDPDTELFIVDKHGDEVDVADLQEWDILTVKYAEGASGRIVYDCVMTREFEEGSIEEDEDSGIRQKLTIDGKVYGVATEAIEYKNKGKFFLDANGKIAGSEEEESTNKYALMIAGGDGTSLTSSESKAYIFTQDGKAEKLTLADDLRVDGDKNWTSIPWSTLIRYSTNDVGHINRIYTAGGDNEELKTVQTGNPLTNASGQTATFYTTPRVEIVTNGTPAKTHSVRLNSATFIFSIEADKTFKVIKPADIANKKEVTKATDANYVTAYNKNSKNEAAVVYIKGPAPISPVTRMGMFSKLVNSNLPDGGGKSYRVQYYNKDSSGAQSVLTYKQDTIFEAIKEGSIVVPTFDYDGFVNKYAHLVDVVYTAGAVSSIAWGTGAPAGTPKKDHNIKYSLGEIKGYEKGTVLIDGESFDIPLTLSVAVFDENKKADSRVSMTTMSSAGSRLDLDGKPKKDNTEAWILVVSDEDKSEPITDVFLFFVNSNI